MQVDPRPRFASLRTAPRSARARSRLSSHPRDESVERRFVGAARAEIPRGSTSASTSAIAAGGHCVTRSRRMRSASSGRRMPRLRPAEVVVAPGVVGGDRVELDAGEAEHQPAHDARPVAAAGAVDRPRVVGRAQRTPRCGELGSKRPADRVRLLHRRPLGAPTGTSSVRRGMRTTRSGNRWGIVGRVEVERRSTASRRRSRRAPASPRRSAPRIVSARTTTRNAVSPPSSSGSPPRSRTLTHRPSAERAQAALVPSRP